MRHRWSLALAALVGFLGVTDAGAHDTVGDTVAGAFAAGDVVTGVLPIDGKQIPLPEGDWVVAADAPSNWNDPGIGSFGYVRTLLLFRIERGGVDTILEVHSNVLPTTDGWGMAADCGRKDLVLAVVRFRAGWDGSCYFVTHSLIDKAPPPAWHKARDFAASKGWALSRIWLTAGFRAADRSDVLDVRYYFSPQTRGIPSEAADGWEASRWMADALDHDPQRRDFAKAVGDWAPAYSSLVQAGLKKRLLSDDTVAMPHGDAAIADPNAMRVAELKALRAAGTISTAEFATEMATLATEATGSSSTAPDLTMMTATKAISYRVIVSISHLFVDYYWTGNLVAAGALEILQITINSAKFYFHELAWAKYMGIPRADAARTIDFKYIGVTQ
jgi:uncharacterized membrane protein